MRARGVLVGALLLGWGSAFFPARATPQEDYLAIYIARPDDPETLEKKGDFPGALRGFQEDLAKLEKIHRDYPTWEPLLVNQRLEECRMKIAELGGPMPKGLFSPPSS